MFSTFTFRSYQRQDSNYMSRQRQPDSGCSSPVRSPRSNMITTPGNSSSNLTQVKEKKTNLYEHERKAVMYGVTNNVEWLLFRVGVFFRCPALRTLHWLRPSKKGKPLYLLLLFTNMLKPLRRYRRRQLSRWLSTDHTTILTGYLPSLTNCRAYPTCLRRENQRRRI